MDNLRVTRTTVYSYSIQATMNASMLPKWMFPTSKKKFVIRRMSCIHQNGPSSQYYCPRLITTGSGSPFLQPLNCKHAIQEVQRRCASSDSNIHANTTSSNPKPRMRHHSSAAGADLARLMVPSDANVAGNVHGGTIMKMMEEAAGVAANRYFNNCSTTSNSMKSTTTTTTTTTQRVCALTSRVEGMTFHHPVHVGDVAKVRAEVVFSSLHTVAVSVEVTAERMPWSTPATTTSSSSRSDIITNDDDGGCWEESVCNKALVWLVGVVLPDGQSISVHQLNPKAYARALAPKFPIPNNPSSQDAASSSGSGASLWTSYQRAAKAYEARKLASSSVPGSSFDEATPYETTEAPVKNISSYIHNDASSGGPACFTPDSTAVELVQANCNLTVSLRSQHPNKLRDAGPECLLVN